MSFPKINAELLSIRDVLTLPRKICQLSIVGVEASSKGPEPSKEIGHLATGNTRSGLVGRQ